MAKNLAEAYAWHLCAIANAKNRPDTPETGGGETIVNLTQESLAALLPTLSKSEIAQGKLLADQYIEKYAKPYWSEAPKS